MPNRHQLVSDEPVLVQQYEELSTAGALKIVRALKGFVLYTSEPESGEAELSALENDLLLEDVADQIAQLAMENKAI